MAKPRVAKPRVCVETTVVSYLTAWPSGNLVTAGHQHVTRQWWLTATDRFTLVASPLVVAEASRGDEQAAKARLAEIANMQILEPAEESAALTTALVESGAVPEKASADAAHIAIAVAGGADYLVTWNCRHIANATARGAIDRVCRDAGFEPIVICTPEELLE